MWTQTANWTTNVIQPACMFLECIMCVCVCLWVYLHMYTNKAGYVLMGLYLCFVWRIYSSYAQGKILIACMHIRTCAGIICVSMLYTYCLSLGLGSESSHRYWRCPMQARPSTRPKHLWAAYYSPHKEFLALAHWVLYESEYFFCSSRNNSPTARIRLPLRIRACFTSV